MLHMSLDLITKIKTEKIFYFCILILLFSLSGCLGNFTRKQDYVPPREEALYLTIGQTTMADVTKILNPSSVINTGAGMMMRTYLYHQNAILYIHVDDHGSYYTQTLNLAALSGYFNHCITLLFSNGVLVQYHIT